MILKNKINPIIFKFVISSTIYGLIQLLSNFFVLLWVQPSEIGSWYSILLISTYFFYIQLGIFNGLNREYPFFLGKKEERTANELAQVALWYSEILTYLSILGSIIFFIVMFVFGFFQKTINYIEVVTLAVVISTQFYQNYLIVTFRGKSSFSKLANVYIIQSFVLLGSLYFVYKFSYSGYLSRIIFTTLSLLLLTHFFRPLKTISKFSKNHFLILLKTGFPQFSMAYFQNLTSTFPRLILVIFFSTTLVGYFAPAWSFYLAMGIFPSAIMQYFYPMISYRYGIDGDKKKVFKLAKKYGFLIFIMLLPIAFFGKYIINNNYEKLFPNYMDGLNAAKILLFGSVFCGANNSLINYLYATKENTLLLKLTLTKMVTFLFLTVIFTFLIEKRLDGIAWGFSIAEFSFLIITFLWIKKNLQKD